MRRWGAPSWFMTTIWILLCLFFIGFGASTVWEAFFALPAAYDRLEAAGVPAIAVIDECRAGLGGGRGVACRISMDFEGVTRAWVYPENSPQFDGLGPGDRVPMLVDPTSPDVAYTVTDVSARTNTGWTGALFGEVLVFVGLAGLVFEANLWLNRRSFKLQGLR